MQQACGIADRLQKPGNTSASVCVCLCVSLSVSQSASVCALVRVLVLVLCLFCFVCVCVCCVRVLCGLPFVKGICVGVDRYFMYVRASQRF